MELKRAIYATALKLSRLEGQRPYSTHVFHMSEAGECSRVIYMRRLKPEERTYKSKMDEARVRMLLNDGRYHQAAVSEYIKQAPGIQITNIEHGRVLPRIVTIDGKSYWYSISGHPDGLVTDLKTNERFLLEVKGLSRFTKGITKLVDNDIESFRACYPKAIPQARLNSLAFETNGAILLFKNKDTSELHECFLPRDTEAEEKILRKFDMIFSKFVTDGQVPCDYIAGDDNCKFCPFASECGYGK